MLPLEPLVAKMTNPAEGRMFARKQVASDPVTRASRREVSIDHLQDTALFRLCGPGGDLLSHALRHSTIGARGLND